MRAYVSRLLWMILFFAVLAVGMNLLGRKLTEQSVRERNVVTGRINAQFQKEVDSGHWNAEALVEKVFTQRRDEWCRLYGVKACPEEVRILLISEDDVQGNAGEKGADAAYGNHGETMVGEPGQGLKVGEDTSKIFGLYAGGRLIGLAEYRFKDSTYGQVLLLMNGCILACALLVILYGIWVLGKVILPFYKLAEYPERLSKGVATEKLPETKNRFFGKYVWSMNMLSDKLENDRQTIRRISDERQKMVTMLVHGIKTPTANIKLLSEAIATGLYDPDGKINEKDAELAGKIEKNADDIEKLVSQAVEAANTVSIEYEPKTETFYRSMIEKFVREEYLKCLEISRIPFRLECEGDPLVKSDLDGICRILRQLMDNAIKYGDGTGIRLKMEKTQEGHLISVTNKGTPLPESELPFVFNSLWRGSNSSHVKGSGVGLYEARVIARKLGGDVRMRAGDGETMVTLFIPL